MTRRRELMTPTELYAARSRQRYAPPVEARTVGSLPPRATPDPPDEGPMAEDHLVTELSFAFDALPKSNRDAITALAFEAGRAHLSFSVRTLPSQRRVDIGNGLVTCWWTCATNTQALEPVDQRAHELVRALLQHVLDDWAILQPAVPLGPTLGALTCDQATRFAELAIAFANGNCGVLFTTTRHMYLATQPAPDDPFAH